MSPPETTDGARIIKGMREAVAHAQTLPHSTLMPRTPATRLAHAMAAFQQEAYRAFAEAEDFIPCDHDAGLSLGDLIREHREILGISLQELASRAGSTKSHVWEIEMGRTANPTVKMVAGLASALGLSTALVFRAALRSTERIDAKR